MRIENKIKSIIGASLLAGTIIIEPDPEPPALRDLRGSTLLERGFYIELYGLCKTPGIDPLNSNQLAEVREDESHTLRMSDKYQDISQLIQTKPLVNPALSIDMNPVRKRTYHIRASIQSDGRTIEEVEGEMKCFEDFFTGQ